MEGNSTARPVAELVADFVGGKHLSLVEVKFLIAHYSTLVTGLQAHPRQTFLASTFYIDLQTLNTRRRSLEKIEAHKPNFGKRKRAPSPTVPPCA